MRDVPVVGLTDTTVRFDVTYLALVQRTGCFVSFLDRHFSSFYIFYLILIYNFCVPVVHLFRNMHPSTTIYLSLTFIPLYIIAVLQKHFS